MIRSRKAGAVTCESCGKYPAQSKHLFVFMKKERYMKPERILQTITADCHLHSSYSGDSHTPMEDMVLSGISRGLNTMCFTEHHDLEYPPYPDLPEDTFLLNTDSYLYTLAVLKEQYADKIKLLFGVELGLQPEVARKNAVYARAYDFDFIIGSSHICHGKDPWYPGFFEGRDTESSLREYFEATLENIRHFSDFDVYGHLDYAVRYAPEKDDGYCYKTYADILDEILKLLLAGGKGIELNTGGIKSGMRDFHPCMDILKRYRELGGEIITPGSDAHDAENIGTHFNRAADVLRECGFRYYCVYEKRKPAFYRL